MEIGGAVSNPISFSMDEIAAMETISFPCTVSCAGNRRKEQNMTKQTVGFNWGAAATGCSVWTGVPLRTILLKAGLKDKKDGARFVCMEGADKLPNGFYGQCDVFFIYSTFKEMCCCGDVEFLVEQNAQTNSENVCIVVLCCISSSSFVLIWSSSFLPDLFFIFFCLSPVRRFDSFFFPFSTTGTCMPIDLAMDPTHDVIIAFEQNGEFIVCCSLLECRMLRLAFCCCILVVFEQPGKSSSVPYSTSL